MEMHTGQTWPSCVCAAVAATNGSKWFSEYHTYASWLLSKHPQRIGRVDSVRFPRNTIAWKQKLRRGDCCLADSEVCSMTVSGEDDRSSFYTVVEEHKPRYRDEKCRDGWRAPRLPGRLAHQVKTNDALSLSAWVFEFYDNDYARAGITAVASLLLVLLAHSIGYNWRSFEQGTRSQSNRHIRQSPHPTAECCHLDLLTTARSPMRPGPPAIPSENRSPSSTRVIWTCSLFQHLPLRFAR